jgi:DNA-binding MarR family transcriptional regulator
VDALSTVLNLALVRSHVVREVDADLGGLHGVSLSDFALLLELHGAPEERLRRVELANRLGVTTSGVARQLGPLERIGLVDREPHERDARLALVVLTAAGSRLVEEALPTAQHAAARTLAAHWSTAEQERLGKLLARARG